MSERTLRDRWRRFALRQGLEVRVMSPHQIRGLSDLLVLDRAVSDMLREWRRGRVHWVETKQLQSGPRAFDAKRDATHHQVKWLGDMAALGCGAWWLVLGPEGWVLVPHTKLKLTRDEFGRQARRYGAPIMELREPERQRGPLVERTMARLAASKARAAKVFTRD